MATRSGASDDDPISPRRLKPVRRTAGGSNDLRSRTGRGSAGVSAGGIDVAHSNRRLGAWIALVLTQAALNVGAVLTVDVPEDRVFRYSNAVQALAQFGAMLAVVLAIARPGGLRRMLALRRPSSWKRAVVLGVVVTLATLVLLAALSPLLDAGEAQRLASDWDGHRALPFAANAFVIILFGPVVEELTFRGLGFTLLERFGVGSAIVLTAVLFAVSHGLVALLPISAAVGVGLALLRSRTESVYPAMAVHVLLNALGLFSSVLG